jgi:phosphoglycolate phosphatase
MSAPLRLVVFDLDGTLVDSKHNIIAAVEEVARILGITCPPQDVIPRVIGLSLMEALAQLFPDVDASRHKALDREYREAFVRLRARPEYTEPLFDGTHEILAELDKHGFLLGIATGKARRGAQHFIARNGFEGRFVTVQTPEDAPGKPHPGMVLNALRETGAEARHTVMIGDTSYDIEMARAAGVHAIGVSWGNHPVAELRAAGAHRCVDRLADLLHAVHDLTAPIPVR